MRVQTIDDPTGRPAASPCARKKVFYPLYLERDIGETMGAAQVERPERSREDLSRLGGITQGNNLRYAFTETHQTSLINQRTWTATTGTRSGHLKDKDSAKKGDK